MKKILLIALVIVVIIGIIYLAKVTNNFTDFSSIFDSAYKHVDKFIK